MTTYDDGYGDDKPEPLKRGISYQPCNYCGKDAIPDKHKLLYLVNTIRFVTSSGNNKLLCEHIVRIDKNPYKPEIKFWTLVWHADCFGHWMIDRVQGKESVHFHETNYWAKP